MSRTAVEVARDVNGAIVNKLFDMRCAAPQDGGTGAIQLSASL